VVEEVEDAFGKGLFSGTVSESTPRLVKALAKDVDLWKLDRIP
jgi:hypothetical protein